MGAADSSVRYLYSTESAPYPDDLRRCKASPVFSASFSLVRMF
jgi:hypothetical protein